MSRFEKKGLDWFSKLIRTINHRPHQLSPVDLEEFIVENPGNPNKFAFGNL